MESYAKSVTAWEFHLTTEAIRRCGTRLEEFCLFWEMKKGFYMYLQKKFMTQVPKKLWRCENK